MWASVLKHLHDPKAILLLQVLVVIGLPLVLWRFMRLGRFFPLAIIQIFTGIALGPSLLGLFWPEGFRFLFPPQEVSPGVFQISPGIATLANIAVVLFVFLAGCEADRQVVRNAAGTVLRIGLIGVLAPWILGTLAAWWLLTALSPAVMPMVIGANSSPFFYAVAFGLCMAVTALPVLVIVLRELGFNRKPIGSIALAIGGLDDAILWASLAVLLPLAASKGGAYTPVVIAVAGGALVLVLMFYVVAPFLEKLIANDAPERLLMSLMIVALFCSAMVTELTGLHAALGAFVTGFLLPDKLRHAAQDKFDVPVTLLLLPFLFLSTGLKASISPGDTTVWVILAVALIVCVGGKFLGVTIPAYLSGQSMPFSVTLGILMQCKGLMEIVVVTILRDQGVIGQSTFTALVLAALISTAMTAPLVRLCERIFGDKASATREADKVDVVVAEPIVVPAAAVPIAPVLPVLEFDHEIGPVPLPKADVQIGRHSEDDVRVDDLRVSRHHARLTALGDGRYELYNQTAVRSEPNPVLVNGVEKERAVLQEGDVVTLGGVTFTFREKPA
jgi:K+:H+ antiporter